MFGRAYYVQPAYVAPQPVYVPAQPIYAQPVVYPPPPPPPRYGGQRYVYRRFGYF